MKGVKKKKKIELKRQNKDNQGVKFSANQFINMSTSELLDYVNKHNHLHVYTDRNKTDINK